MKALASRLSGTSFEIAEAHHWGMLTRGLLEVYKDYVRIINISCEGFIYSKLMTKLQELSMEDIGDPTVPLKKQTRVGISAAALNTVEEKKDTSKVFRFSGTCFWCQKKGHRETEYRARLEGKTQNNSQSRSTGNQFDKSGCPRC